MSLHLITGPAHSGKSDYLVDKFCDLLSENPVLVVPTATAAQAWRRRFVDILGVLTLGRVETLSTFITELHQRLGARPPILATSGVQLLVRHIVEQEQDALGPLKTAARRRGFVTALTRLIGEMENGGLTTAGIQATLTAEPQSLSYGGDVITLFRAYQQRLTELGLTDRQLALTDVADDLVHAGTIWKAPVLLAGFAELNHTEERLLRSLSLNADVYVSLTHEQDNPELALPKRTAERLGKIASTVKIMPPDSRGDPHYRFQSAGGRRAEIELTGALIAKRLREGKPPESIGVVTRDIAPYKDMIGDVFSSYHVPFTIAERLPLRRTSLGRTVLLLLSCLIGPGDNMRAELTAFLRSPFSGAPDGTVDEFDHLARRYSIGERSKLIDLIDETAALQRSKIIVDILAHPPGSGRQLLVSLQEILPHLWLNAHKRTNSDDPPAARQALEDTAAYRLVSEEIARLADLTEQTGISVATSFIRELLSNLRLNISLSASTAAVTITDAADCHTFLFKEVYIIGLNQQEFPRLREEDPFLNDADRRLIARATGARLPLKIDEPDRERYLFYQARTRGSETVNLSSRYCDADGRDETESFYLQDVRSELKSRGISIQQHIRRLGDMALPLELAPTDDELRRSIASHYKDSTYRKLAATAGMNFDIDQAANSQVFRKPALMSSDTLAELRRRTKFSATELETYLACPFKWFVQKIIRPISMTPDAAALFAGSLAHSVLATALPEALTGAEDTGTILRRRIGEAIAQLADEHEDIIQTRVTAASLMAMLASFIEHELRRLSLADGFMPMLYEHSFGGPEEHEVRLSQDVVLTGRVDRIDKGRDDSVFVVDYKTGALAGGAIGDFDQNRLLQGLLYSLAAQKALNYTPIGCGYYSLKQQKWKSLAVTGATAALNMGKDCVTISEDEFTAAVGAATAKALEVIDRLRGGDISLSLDNKDICGYCQSSVCREAQAKAKTAWG